MDRAANGQARLAGAATLSSGSPRLSVRARGRGRRRTATSVTSSAAGMSPWNRCVGIAHGADDVRGRPRRAPTRTASTSRVLAEPLAVGGLRVGDPVGVEQHEVARLERDRRTRCRSSRRYAPRSGPEAVQPADRLVVTGPQEQRRLVAGVREPQDPGAHDRCVAHRAVMNRAERRSSTRILLVRSSASTGSPGRDRWPRGGAAGQRP